jgi:UDP-glucose 4-epimerase
VKTALVTGCAGFIGSELSRLLLDAGYEVTGIDNLSRGTERHLDRVSRDPAFHFVQGDIRCARDVERAFENPPAFVFHLAARHFIPECAADPAGTYEINIVGSQRVWDAANASRAARFLLVSSGDVYKPSAAPHRETDPTEPFNAYGLSKLTAERALMMAHNGSSPTLVIARLFNVYGPGETNPHLLPEILRQVRGGARRIELGNLWPVRDFIFVRDAAEALCRLAELPDPPRVVNVGTGGGWSVRELVEILAAATSLTIEVVTAPDKCRAVERDVLRPDISLLTSVTGWRPRSDLSRGLSETLEAME